MHSFPVLLIIHKIAVFIKRFFFKIAVFIYPNSLKIAIFDII